MHEQPGELNIATLKLVYSVENEMRDVHAQDTSTFSFFSSRLVKLLHKKRNIRSSRNT